MNTTVRPAAAIRFVLLCVFLLTGSVSARSDLLGTDWNMTSEEVQAADPDVTAVEEPFINSADQVYKFRKTVRSDEYTFTAQYFFRADDDLLDAIVLRLTEGSAESLFDVYNNGYGPGEVEKELQIIDNKFVHEVRFRDADRNNRITYDRRGDTCKIIFAPLLRGAPV